MPHIAAFLTPSRNPESGLISSGDISLVVCRANIKIFRRGCRIKLFRFEWRLASRKRAVRIARAEQVDQLDHLVSICSDLDGPFEPRSFSMVQVRTLAHDGVARSRWVAVSFLMGLEVGEVAIGRPVAESHDGPENPDATQDHFSASRDISFCKLRLRQSNVRHVQAGVSIEELAEDIAQRTLLASLTFRSIPDETGAETGLFEIPAGGRRYRALELLVK